VLTVVLEKNGTTTLKTVLATSWE